MAPLATPVHTSLVGTVFGRAAAMKEWGMTRSVVDDMTDVNKWGGGGG